MVETMKLKKAEQFHIFDNSRCEQIVDHYTQDNSNHQQQQQAVEVEVEVVVEIFGVTVGETIGVMVEPMKLKKDEQYHIFDNSRCEQIVNHYIQDNSNHQQQTVEVGVVVAIFGVIVGETIGGMIEPTKLKKDEEYHIFDNSRCEQIVNHYIQDNSNHQQQQQAVEVGVVVVVVEIFGVTVGETIGVMVATKLKKDE